MLRSDLCDYSNAYIAVKGRIHVRANANIDIDQKDSTLKNNAPFRSCITKMNSTLIDKEEDLDIVMSMYNPFEYSQNYSMTSENLLNYYRYEIDDADDNASDGNLFECKTKIIRKKEARPSRPALPPPNPDRSQRPQLPQPPQLPIPPLNTEVTIPFKYLSNF